MVISFLMVYSQECLQIIQRSVNVSGEETYTEQAVCGRVIALSFEAEQWLRVCRVCSLFLSENCARPHTHTHTHSWKTFETISKWLGGGGCSHNNVSLLAFFCGSKSGSMFVDAEGGMEECVCVCGCVCARALVMNGTHHRPALVIPSHAVCIYLNKLNFWFTGTFMDIVPCTCFSSTLLTASPHFSLSLSSLL